MGISLCMIVKNEEDWVVGAVESVRSIVDEVIIVDIGSSDSTPVRIRVAGAKLLKWQWTEARCLSLNPENPIAVFNYGLVLRKTGDHIGALSFYNRAVCLDLKFRKPKPELAVLYLQASKSQDALSALETLPNTDAIVLSLLRSPPLRMDDLDAAQGYLESALRRDCSLADARLNLAQIYSRKGDHARAARYVQSVSVK